MLLAVLYGAYIALNGSDTPLPQEFLNMTELDVRTGSDGNAVQQTSLPPLRDPQGAQGFSMKSDGFGPPASTPTNVIDTNLAFSPPPTSPNGSANLASPPPQLLTSNNTSSGPNNTTPGRNTVPPPSPFPSPSQNSSTGFTTPNSNFAAPSNTLQTPTAIPLLASNNQSNDSSSNGSFANPSSDGFNTSLTGLQQNNDPPSLTNNSDTSPSSLPNATSSRSFMNAKKMADEQIARGELKEALATLSLFYNAVELTHDQHQELLEMLDPLAGEVIYSRRHLLDIAYVTNQGEVLEEIAKQYEVPADILAKINAVDAVAPLQAGMRLKVVPGPFRGEIDLQRSELTLFVGELYAGRFPIELGGQSIPSEGVFQVKEKQRHRNYYGPGGMMIQGQDPRNPYGGWWIDLGQDICLHGTPEQPDPNSQKLGCISLSPIDASDVYGMLSRGSKVQIRR